MHCSSTSTSHAKRTATQAWSRSPSTPLTASLRQPPVLDLTHVFENTCSRYDTSSSSDASPVDLSPAESDPPASVKVEEYLDYVQHQSPGTDLSFDIAFEDDFVPYQSRKQAVLGPSDSFDGLGYFSRPASGCGIDHRRELEGLGVIEQPMSLQPSLLFEDLQFPTYKPAIVHREAPIDSRQQVAPFTTVEPRAVLGDFAAPTSPQLALAGLGLGLSSYTANERGFAADTASDDDEMDGVPSTGNPSPDLLQTPLHEQQQLEMQAYPARSYSSMRSLSDNQHGHSFGPYPAVIKTEAATFPPVPLHQPVFQPPRDYESVVRHRRTESTEQGTVSSEGKRKLGGANARVAADKERQRIFHACDACRKRKAKCDAGDPCGRCTQKRIPCHYSEVRNMRGQNKHKKPPGSRKEAATARAGSSKFARTDAPTVTAYVVGSSQHVVSHTRSDRRSDNGSMAAGSTFSPVQTKRDAMAENDDEDDWSDSENMSTRNQPQWTVVKTEIDESHYPPQPEDGIEVEVGTPGMQEFTSPRQQEWTQPHPRPLSKSDPVRPSHLPLGSPMAQQEAWSSTYPPASWPSRQEQASPNMNALAGPSQVLRQPFTAPAIPFQQASGYFDMQHAQYQGYGTGHLYTDGSYASLQRVGMGFAMPPAMPGYPQPGMYRASFAGMPTQYGNYMSPNGTSYHTTPMQGGQSTLMAESPLSDHPPAIGSGMTGISYSTTSHVRSMSMAEGVDRAFKGHASGAATLSPPQQHPRVISEASADAWSSSSLFPRQPTVGPYAEAAPKQGALNFAPTPTSDQASASNSRSSVPFPSDLNGTSATGTPDPGAVGGAAAARWNAPSQDYFTTGTPPTDAAWNT